MTRSVWKYPLEPTSEPQLVQMPDGAKIIHVGMQVDQLAMWADAVIDTPDCDRWFCVEGTGWPIHHQGWHVGTVLMHGAGFVWHVYEITGTKERYR